MNTAQPLPLEQHWKERLGLASRHAPDFYESIEIVSETPHASAIRRALEAIGVSALFCVQGVPTVAIVTLARYDRDKVIEMHGALWNQGLASVLLVIADDTVRVFSLARKPYRDLGEEFDSRCLIQTLHATADALELRNIVYEAESGRLWKEHADYFKTKERIDQVLLDNLMESHRLLQEGGLGPEAAQALLMQAMFIAYLEDRGIITDDYFRTVTKGAIGSFLDLLRSGNVRHLKSLFSILRTDFNGDLFVAPCSFEVQTAAPAISSAQLSVLARFRTGHEEMTKGGGQLRFWGYDFRYIPIELISAVYDRFLGEQEEMRREQGAYYTPMFLADTVIAQVWDLLPPAVADRGTFLDPACGSGVFLVRSFQRLCEQWRATRKSHTIRWDSLRAILSRLHGWDVNGDAVRVAVFSLYVALLEEVTPPDVRLLIKRGKVLPELWDKQLLRRDFFDAPEDSGTFDVILGNPPWTSRRGPNRSSVRWSKKHKRPMPGGEDAWAFVWKALRYVSDEGMIAFLLPAMGFLHNHAASSISARNQLIRESKLLRIINFADLRFQLFEGAVRPAAFVALRKPQNVGAPYRFDYWAPKADLNLRIKRLITLSSADRTSLSSQHVVADPLVFKRRLWMREPDEKLFAYLSRFATLGDLIKDYGTISRNKQQSGASWIIGQGFQPFHGQSDAGKQWFRLSDYVGKLPYLPIEAFQRIAQPVSGLSPWPSRRVRRRGFEQGFLGHRILIPQGVETSQMRLRATYVESDLTFQHILQAVTVPHGEETRAKLLTALLNSRVPIWYAFNGTAYFGSDRPKVQQADLLRLPFPNPTDLPEPERAKKAARKLVAIVDKALQEAQAPFQIDAQPDGLLREIDKLAYEYFCLSEDEMSLIEDMMERVVPAVQPHQGTFPEIWKPPSASEREAYTTSLIKALHPWMQEGCTIHALLQAKTPDLGLLQLTLTNTAEDAPYRERTDGSLEDALARISEHIHQPLDGNFQLVPDFRVFVCQSLYLVKPMQQRFWMRSTALADADAIAMDLQHATDLNTRRSHA